MPPVFTKRLTKGARVSIAEMDANWDSAASAIGAVEEAQTFMAAGAGAVARTVQAKLKDAVSVLDFGAKGDGATDDHAAFTAALATGKPIIVPASAQPYLLSNYLDFASGAVLIGEGRPTLKATVTGRLLRFNALSNALVQGVVLNGNKAGVVAAGPFLIQNSSRVVLRDIDVNDASGNSSITGTSVLNRIEHCSFSNSAGTAISLSGAAVSRNIVAYSEFHDNAGFAVQIAAGSSSNLVTGCRTISNGIELVGITRDSHGNRIIGNHAELCGDNGISVTGYENTIVGNVCKYNRGAGVYVYGRVNTVVGNVCIGNGSNYATDGLQWGGIVIGGFWGGTAQRNIVVGNVIDDDQATPTQYFGIKISSVGYTAWSAGLVVTSGQYVTNALKLYQSTGAGTTGATAPTHTTGTVSDGTVSWTYVDSFFGTQREPSYNTVGTNQVVRYIGGDIVDSTTNQTNTILTEAGFTFASGNATNVVTGGFRRRLPVWASGTAYTYASTVSTSAGRIYRCTNVGGTASVAPTHTSGTTTGADSIAWTYAGTGVAGQQIIMNATDVRFDMPVRVAAQDSIVTYATWLAGSGSPEGKVTAGVGSFFSRTDGGAGTCLYVKESGAGSTGWVAK